MGRAAPGFTISAWKRLLVSQSESTHLRAVHGAVYLKEMNVEGFLKLSRRLEDSIENSAIFKD